MAWCDGAWWEHELEGGIKCGDDRRVTHWMPLPAPPVAATEHSDAPPRPDYYAQGSGGTKYIRGEDPEVTCGHCGLTFLCDSMDAACRLCHKFFRDAPRPEVKKR